MAGHLIPLHCDALQIGMYIAELDRSWLHTPFLGHGFLINQRAQIDALRRYCNYVYIDPDKSEPGVLSPPGDSRKGLLPTSSNAGQDPLVPVRTTLRELVARIAAAVRDARRYGRIELTPLYRCAEMLVETISVSPDAALWLLMTENGSGLINRRAVGTATLSVIFGRHLGFKSPTLRQLALGGLLLDIGKTAVPMPILVKPNSLSPHERLFVNRHVAGSLSILRNDGEIPDRVIEMILGHHERLDGSGYPRRLKGTRIPVFARIAGIVDTFDALTVNRRYASGMSGHGALRFLDALRGAKFDNALVGEFIHALGVFPTGTCVEMEDGSLGMVCGQNPHWSLQPHLVMVRDQAGHTIEPLPVLESDIHTHIARSLPLHSLNFDRHQLEEAFRGQ